MQKKYLFIKEEKGFILPFVLVISLIIILLVTTSIKMYQSELLITQNLIDQIKIDTIIQMSLERLKDDLNDKNHSEAQFTYTFPQGDEVYIQSTFLEDNTVNLTYEIIISQTEQYQVTQLYSFDNIVDYEE